MFLPNILWIHRSISIKFIQPNRFPRMWLTPEYISIGLYMRSVLQIEEKFEGKAKAYQDNDTSCLTYPDPLLPQITKVTKPVINRDKTWRQVYTKNQDHGYSSKIWKSIGISLGYQRTLASPKWALIWHQSNPKLVHIII